jgi:hypothetical protein
LTYVPGREASQSAQIRFALLVPLYQPPHKSVVFRGNFAVESTRLSVVYHTNHGKAPSNFRHPGHRMLRATVRSLTRSCAWRSFQTGGKVSSASRRQSRGYLRPRGSRQGAQTSFSLVSLSPSEGSMGTTWGCWGKIPPPWWLSGCLLAVEWFCLQPCSLWW